MRVVVSIFFVLVCGFSWSQNYGDPSLYLVDSLPLHELDSTDTEIINARLKEYHEAKSDTAKVRAIHWICEELLHDDWVKYLDFEVELIESYLADERSKEEIFMLKSMLAKSYNFQGYNAKHNHDNVLALSLYNKALKAAKDIKDRETAAQALYNKGVLYTIQGSYADAIQACTDALTELDKIGAKDGKNSCLGQIGIIYKVQGDYDKALEYYLKSLAMDSIQNDVEGMSSRLNNIAVVYVRQKKYTQALDYYNKCIAIDQELQDYDGIATAYNNIGALYKFKEDLDSALFYFNKGLSVREEHNDKWGLANSNVNIGEIYRLKRNYPKAILHSQKAYDMATVLGDLKTANHASKQLYESFKATGKYSQALKMHEIHIKLNDSLLSAKNSRELIKQEYKYQYEKQHFSDSLSFIQEQQITTLAHESQLAEEQNRRYLLYGGLLFLLILGGLAYRGYRIKQKDNEVILAQKTEVEHQKLLVEEKNKEILDSISYAKRIQSAILPPDKLVKEYLQNSFILYKPKDIVAGDFYWMEHKDGKVLFAAADCTGHGVPGAMVSVVCNNGLNRSVREHGLTEPGKILDRTREIVVAEFEKSEEDVKDGMDIALCSLEGKTLQYAGAHNPLWIVRAGEIIEIKADKQPIGKYRAATPYTTHTIELQTGDSIYVFSDGYADQFGGEKGKKYKTVNFKKLLLSINDKNMSDQRELIDEAFETWKGELEQLDDVCVIGVRIE